MSILLDDAFHPLGSSKFNRHFSWEVLKDSLDEWVLLLGRGCGGLLVIFEVSRSCLCYYIMLSIIEHVLYDFLLSVS